MQRRVFIHANNIHQGGGRELLLALLKVVSAKLDWIATLDARLTPLKNSLGEGRIKWVAPSALQRLNSEWWISRHVQQEDVLLCLGNLPPLFRSRGRVIVFVQNRYFVQTPTMKSLLQSRIASAKAVSVLPFVGANEGYSRSAPAQTPTLFKYDFLYVASGEPHKNHRNLIEAWCLLAQAGMFPSLCITVDEASFPEIFRWLQLKKTEIGLKLENLGSIPHAQIRLLYGQARAFIFTSAFESLGLPLIEARQAGLPVLAPELDYVRDVLDPDQVFDASSPISIARAVKRFLDIEEAPLRLLDAEGFMSQILQGTE